MKDAAYWIALAHLPKWGHQKINSLIVKFHHNNEISIEDFFHLPHGAWANEYGLKTKEILELQQAKSDLSNYSFISETLFNQGFELIPIISKLYSQTLKRNLKTSHSPSLLYVKGNRKLLQERAVAIVGSRDASERSLKFTDLIAKKSTERYQVVVSGFARGVDRQALDSAVKYNGQSIIVLPQGIMTFTTGYKEYYKQIVNGDILILSTFFPKAPWKTELAMARNPIIYGLADDIYVAESAEKGGTWSGVQDGLKKGRKIFVRIPTSSEKNANQALIKAGAVPIDELGNIVDKSYPIISEDSKTVVHESNDSLEEKIRNILKNRTVSATEILEKLQLGYSVRKLNTQLKKLEFVDQVKIKNKIHYKLKISDRTQASLF